MANAYFQFKQFSIQQDRCAMKVTTDACLFGAWCAGELQSNCQASTKELKILDIGAGTGLLSLMVAQKTDGHVDAVEIEAAAAVQAEENTAASPWADRIKIFQANILQWQPPHNYDCIFSNPPFYETDLRSPKTNKNLAHHNAALGLVGLFSFIKNYLKDEGDFFLLLPAKRLSEAERISTENNLHIHQTVLVKQTPTHPPFRVMIKGSKKQQAGRDELSIIIKDGDAYTLEFTSLLKDYYLYL